MIAIVIILILIVGGNIFFGGDNKDKEQATGALTTENKKEQNQEDQSDKEDKQTSDDQGAETDDNNVEDEEEEESAIEDEEIIETETDEANVEKVIINPSWKPIGTEQTSGHQSSWSMGSVDWNEKLQAAAYATDIPVENMTAWWVEGGDNPENQAILTVSAKGGSDFFRVYIDWIEGEGWKPTEVKKLIENDKKS